jgi:hypothetical protein
MNPYSAAGLASGIASGVQQFQQARANEQTMQNARRQLQLQEVREDRLGAAFDLQKQQQEMQLQQMQFEMEQMRKSTAKKEAVDAHLAALRDKNPEHFNILLRENKYFKQMAERDGIANYSSLDELSEEKQKAIGYDPDTMKDIKDLLFVQEKTDGSKVLYRADGGAILMGGGKLLSDTTLSQLQQYQTKLKLREQEATTGLTVEQQNIMTEAVKTQDADKVMEALKLVKPELFVAGKTGRMDSLTQLITAAAMAGLSDEATAILVGNFAKKLAMGTSVAGEDIEVQQLDEARAEARSMFDQSTDSFDIPKAQGIEDKILYDLPDTAKQTAKDAKKELESNHNTATEIDDLLANPNTVKIDKDIIADAKTWVESKLGVESAQSLANVDFNTKAGMLLYGYIHTMSGSAYSQNEINAHMKTLMSGNLNDESYIRRSMASFSEQIKHKNTIMGKKYIDTLPATVAKTAPSLIKTKEKPPLESFNSGKTTKPDLSSFGTGSVK